MYPRLSDSFRLIPLQIQGLTSKEARLLFLAGVKGPAELSAVSIQRLARYLYGHMQRSKNDESAYESITRRCQLFQRFAQKLCVEELSTTAEQ